MKRLLALLALSLAFWTSGAGGQTTTTVDPCPDTIDVQMACAPTTTEPTRITVADAPRPDLPRPQADSSPPTPSERATPAREGKLSLTG